jgi:hypothetical protein
MKISDPRIVADGAQRLRDAMGYEARRKELRAEGARRHAAELRAAPIWRRLWLEANIAREVREALQKEFPPGALHLAR